MTDLSHHGRGRDMALAATQRRPQQLCCEEGTIEIPAWGAEHPFPEGQWETPPTGVDSESAKPG